MKKIILIIIAIIAVMTIYVGYGVSKVKDYEEAKAEWKGILQNHGEAFEYAVQNLKHDEVSHIELSDEIEISYIKDNTINEISDDKLLTALNEIKKCGIDLIIRYDANGGWSFINQEEVENETLIHEIGIYYSENRENGFKHIQDNWFFRNTKYDMQNESAICRTIYTMLYE